MPLNVAFDQLALPAGSVDNSELADMAANTVKAEATGSASSPQDLAMAASRILARLAAGNLKAATPAEIKTLLDLEIGTDVQAWDADLDTYAGKSPPSGDVVGTTDAQTLTAKIVRPGVTTETGTSRTLALADEGEVIYCTNAALVTITIDKVSSVAYPVGYAVVFYGSGAGLIKIQGIDTDVTVNGSTTGTVTSSAAFKGLSVVHVASDVWVAIAG